MALTLIDKTSHKHKSYTRPKLYNCVLHQPYIVASRVNNNGVIYVFIDILCVIDRRTDDLIERLK